MQAGVPDFLALAGMNLVAYLAFSFGYFNFINLNIASLRIRMLQELAEAGGEMPVEALTGLYNTEEVIALRIDRLASGGHLSSGRGVLFRQAAVPDRGPDFRSSCAGHPRQPPDSAAASRPQTDSRRQQGAFMNTA